MSASESAPDGSPQGALPRPLQGVRLELYDTTLRDGTQGEGISFTSDDKVAIAQRLDAFGVDLIEGGWPGSNPKDAEFFARMREVPLRRARLSAFGSTRRKGIEAQDDANLRALLDAATPVVTIFGKSWPLHVREALATTLDENLAMIGDSIAFMKAQGAEVIYDAEHFYDGWGADPAYALATLEVAVAAGAERIVLCDTNGGSLPETIAAGVRAALGVVGGTPLGIHAHDDAGLGVANSMSAILAGARHLQGTVNGYGERCGNADWLVVLANAVLKLGAENPQPLGDLLALSRYIDDRANLEPNLRRPYVGAAAFAHKGGIHVSAVNRRPDTYEHTPPESVGNQRRVLLSDLSGRANVAAMELDEAYAGDAGELVARMKELEHSGYVFEGAEASFRLLARRMQGAHRPFFTLQGYSLFIDKRDGDAEPRTEATVRVAVGSEAAHTAASGDGPVNALDRALRKALIPFYPSLAQMRLVDYKVRVVDGPGSGTASIVRVHVETTDGSSHWGTVGAHTNIIDASYDALLDAIESKLLADGVPLAGGEFEPTTIA